MPHDPLFGKRGYRTLFGAILFISTFLLVFWLTLPGEVVLTALSAPLARGGISIAAGEARILFPPGIALRKADVSITGTAEPLRLDTLSARIDPLLSFRGLPLRFAVSRGDGSIDLWTSPNPGSPERGRLRISRFSSDTIRSLLPPSESFSVDVEGATAEWRPGEKGPAGSGRATLSRLRIPFRAADSPVREAVLQNVKLDFTLRNGGLQISSLIGTYEGSAIEGTGEIAHILTPQRASITFHLKIRNPYEGKIASMFNLVAKNAKNANLRIAGPLLSPSGEFQFF